MIEYLLILLLGYTLAWAFENQDRVKAIYKSFTKSDKEQ